jgi:hypothetical protein
MKQNMERRIAVFHPGIGVPLAAVIIANIRGAEHEVVHKQGERSRTGYFAV